MSNVMESSLSDAHIFQKPHHCKDTRPLKRSKYSLSFEIQPLKQSQTFTRRLTVLVKPRKPPIKILYNTKKSLYSSSCKQSSQHELTVGEDTSSSRAEQTRIHKCLSVVSTKKISKYPNSRFVLVGRCHCSFCNYIMASEKGSKKDDFDNNTDVDLETSDKATLIITNTSSESASASEETVPGHKKISFLQQRLDALEREAEALPLPAIDPIVTFTSSDNHYKKSDSMCQVGCSYISQYSHIPETSFRKQETDGPPSRSKRTASHYFERYKRNIHAYDGLTTAKGRKQSASMPFKRADIPRSPNKKFRTNPLREYRLLDCMHYLAQGEFAPRDDGIKLTPSREAILSDIIWEDVCRTNWPNARLARRTGIQERPNVRTELQKQIDVLIKERVAHVERRRRRHYRIMKMNQKTDEGNFFGKTGDVIVANNKSSNSRETNNENSQNNNTSRLKILTDQKAGPSRISKKSSIKVLQASTIVTKGENENFNVDTTKVLPNFDESAENCANAAYSNKKNSSSSIGCIFGARKDFQNKGSIMDDLDHYMLLPTLVVKTPSNIRRQKKFNELYQKIMRKRQKDQTVQQSPIDQDTPDQVEQEKLRPASKDIGLCIRIKPVKKPPPDK